MKRRYRHCAVLNLFFVAAAATAAQAPPARTSSLEQLMTSLATVREFRSAAISPDGTRVAYAESLPSRDENAPAPTAIFVVPAGSPDAKPQRITAGDGKSAYDEHGPVWSPDSSRLAFLSDRETKGQLQLYVSPAAGGSARKLTNLNGFLTGPQWSPDGKNIAVLFTEDAPRSLGPLDPVPAETGVIESKIYEQRLAVVDAGSGAVRQISPTDMYIYEYDWSPDGRRFAAIAAPGDGDNNWWIARLYTISAANSEMKQIFEPQVQQQIAVPRWSPDGSSIAFIAGLMSDQGAVGGEIYVAAPDGGAARNLTPGIASSPANLNWVASKKLIFTEHRDGGTSISQLDPASGQTERLWAGDETIHAASGWDTNISLAADGRTSALIRKSWQRPPEVWAGPLGEWRQVTSGNTAHRPAWGAARSIHWMSDGEQVQGWLLYPEGLDPDHAASNSNRRYPMVVSPHGGPASMNQPGWPGLFFDLSLLSHEGYFVFFPNPRGSYGQGETFAKANVKDFGYGDMRDILAGMDEVLKIAPVDSNRIGIGGWSYGGYMTMWAITQTNRFRAAVAGAGIANWQSYYGENAIDQWMIPYFGASVYDNPAVYAKSSPITFIKQVKTPTLILVGERDGECPIPQSFEFWHALRTMGVKTEMVVYPGEGHMFSKPEHRQDTMRRAAAWFNDNLR